jgi:hypothetical protein
VNFVGKPPEKVSPGQLYLTNTHTYMFIISVAPVRFFGSDRRVTYMCRDQDRNVVTMNVKMGLFNWWLDGKTIRRIA